MHPAIVKEKPKGPATVLVKARICEPKITFLHVSSRGHHCQVDQKIIKCIAFYRHQGPNSKD